MERSANERLKKMASEAFWNLGFSYTPDLNEQHSMARELLAYRESGALEALKNLNERVRYWAENPRPDEWILQEWVRIIDAAIAKLEAIEK